jgi:carboxypeptidase C (cathepsin A)
MKHFKDIYLAGESYGGKYIPWFANYLSDKGLNIKGISVGNGAVNPEIQN